MNVTLTHQIIGDTLYLTADNSENT